MSLSLHPEVISQIKQNIGWSLLPKDIKQFLGNSQKEYDNAILLYSLENNLRFKENIISTIEKDEKKYYEKLIKYCNEHLMLFPYHLSDIYIRGLRFTPFLYYKNLLQDVMRNEKSYDSIPNFTALDILRLLDIGRNQYIDLMNKCHRNKKNPDSKQQDSNISRLLPSQPISGARAEPWWIIRVGHVTCQDAKLLSKEEKKYLDCLIDSEDKYGVNLKEGNKERRFEEDHIFQHIIDKLYLKGLIYFDIPIQDTDIFVVPPLKSFVMNRLQGDSVENLLYSIFAVLDPSLNVSRLADHVLDLEKELVIRGVSLLNRLGLAVPYHITAYPHTAVYSPNDEMETPSLEGDISLDSFIENLNISDAENKTKGSSEQDSSPSMKSNPYDVLPTSVKKIGLVFDSMLAAFLMMGNLSQGLKTHAITMFETGKLPWESLQDFLKLLEQVDIEACLNDDIKIYANVSQALKNTLMVLISTFSPSLSPSCLAVNVKTNYTNIHGLDMLKCESFTQLNRTTCDRILEKYETIIYISPISQSVCPILNLDIPIFGPCMPEMKTPWFRLFLYYVFQNGPVSLLLRRGTRLTRLPNIFKVSQFLSLSTWEHEPIVIPMNSSLLAINDALTSYPLLIQPYPVLDQAQSNDNYLIYLNSLQSDASNIDANDSKNPAISDSLPKNDDKHPILDHTFPFGKDNFNNAATADLKHLSRFKYFKHSLGYIRCIKLPVLSATNKDWLLQLPVKPLIEEDLEKSLWDASDRLMSNESIYENEHSKGYEWCFYDCNLGIPLSDLVLNNQILTLIKSNEPFNNENLRELKMATNIFSQCFLQFMKNCQYFDHTSIPLDTEELIFPGKERDKYKDFSYPRNNLLIYRNKVLLWEI